jgi:hypothetical protein
VRTTEINLNPIGAKEMCRQEDCLLMSPNQEQIAQWLTGKSASLHDAYVTALRLLADPQTSGRAQMICHACRDLCTGLQDLQSVAKKERADTASILGELDSVWRKEGLEGAGLAWVNDSASGVEQAAEPEVSIPRYLLPLLQRLLEEHRRGELNQEEQATQLFRSNDPMNANRPEAVQPLSKEWVRLRRWFIRYAHFGVQQRIPEEKELQQHFAALESFILGVIRPFYEGMEGLDEILDEANS